MSKKKKQKEGYPKSFATRLTRRIMLMLFVLTGIASYALYRMIYDSTTDMIRLYSSELVSSTSKSVGQVLSDVYVAAVNTIPDIEESLDKPDKLYTLMEQLTKLNPRVRSCGISFIEDYYPEKGHWFCPYAVKLEKDSTEVIETSTIGSEDNDYLHQEWFIQARQAEEGYWSKPFFDSNDSLTILTSYVAPIHDKQGRTVAVLGVDLSLDWLSKKIQKDFKKTINEVTKIWSRDNNFKQDQEEERNLTQGVSIRKNGNIEIDIETDEDEEILATPFMFIIDSEGTYIAHPDKKRLLRENFFDYAKETADTLDEQLGRMMTRGVDGSMTIPGDERLLGVNIKDRYVFFTHLKHVDWSMGFYFPCIYAKMFSFLLGIALLLFTFIPLLLAIYIFGRILIKRSVKPVKVLATSAGEVARGNFNNELPQVTSRDEIQMLRDSFEKMQHSLKNYMIDLQATTAVKTAIENELKIAHDIQMSMLPKTYPPFPERNDIDIFGTLTPAKAVGGDLFDFYIRDEQLFFCIGDVSGKGIPAAMVMAVTRSLFRNVSSYVTQPNVIVSALNKSLADNNDNEMFVTLFIGVFDLATGRLHYCNAGHNAPLLMDSKGEEMLPVDANLPVGILSDWEYSLQETLITPQSTLFLYTDGLTEAENANHEQFQEERMMNVARNSNHEPRSLIFQMTKAVKKFVDNAEQSDDLTMLAIKYTVPQRADITVQHAITLPNDVEEVPRLAAFVDQVCEEAGYSMEMTMDMNLAIEEAVVNVMDYAYEEGTKGNVHIEAEADASQLTIIISDWGKPFDPTSKPDVDTSMSAEERDIGGLGIHLVRQIMDSVSYERIQDTNRLTLRKKTAI